MPNSLTDRYRRWFEYEKEAHSKVLDAFETVPESKWTDLRFRKALDHFSHIVAARWLWLKRFGKTNRELDDIFPTGTTLDELRSRADEMHKAWTDYLADLDEAELARIFNYQSFEGPHYTNRVEDLTTQLFGHSWYHRGQIAALIRSLGGTPAETDYVFWTRRPAEKA
jgi:uncharacterized damage-inducible protein DinB